MNPLIQPILQRKIYLEELLLDITHKLKLVPEAKPKVSATLENERGGQRYYPWKMTYEICKIRGAGVIDHV